MRNLLLEPIDYKIEETTVGTWRKFLHPNGDYYAEFISHAEILGIPVLHYTRGKCPETGSRVVAKGIIAVGRFAVGIVGIGQVSVGVIAFGQLGLGLLFGLGQATTGVLAFGQLAIAALFGLGRDLDGVRCHRPVRRRTLRPGSNGLWSERLGHEARLAGRTGVLHFVGFQVFVRTGTPGRAVPPNRVSLFSPNQGEILKPGLERSEGPGLSASSHLTGSPNRGETIPLRAQLRNRSRAVCRSLLRPFRPFHNSYPLQTRGSARLRPGL